MKSRSTMWLPLKHERDLSRIFPDQKKKWGDFSTMDSEASMLEACALSAVLRLLRQRHSGARLPGDRRASAHYLCSPSGRHTFLCICLCTRITFPSQAPRGPKTRQLLQEFATQFVILLKRRGKWRMGGWVVLHMWEKYERLSSHQLHVYF